MENIPDFPAGLGYSKDEADDFLDRVDDINKQIQDIISGKVDVQELDRKDKELAEKERLKKLSKEIKEREAKELFRKGRPGKGHQGGYKTFCRACFREFLEDGVDICAVCGKETMTQEERMDELKTKLEEYKQKTGKKKTRRAKWENWKKT